MKVLLLGGSHRDIPLIETLKKKGFFVITLANASYYIGHKFANKYYNIDFNDLKSVKEIIKKEKVDYLIAGCGEESFYNSALLANEFSLGEYDDKKIVEIIHNKWKFKEFCLKNSIPTPKGSNDYKELEFPIIIKPQNLSGGKGVSVVYNEKELKNAINIAKKFSNNLVFEEFIDAEIIAYSAILKNQKVVYNFVAKDIAYLNPYLISTAHSYEIDKNIKNSIKKDIEKIAKILMLKNGPFHAQILLKNNKYYFMDVTRRIAGDLFPYLIEYADNVNYSEMVINSYIGMDFEVNKGDKKYAIRHCVMPKKNGVYEGIECKVDYKLRLDLMTKGEIIKDYTKVHTAIFILVFNKYTEMLNVASKINDLIYAKVKD
jgi:biotin carboxylase